MYTQELQTILNAIEQAANEGYVIIIKNSNNENKRNYRSYRETRTEELGRNAETDKTEGDRNTASGLEKMHESEGNNEGSAEKRDRPRKEKGD